MYHLFSRSDPNFYHTGNIPKRWTKILMIRMKEYQYDQYVGTIQIHANVPCEKISFRIIHHNIEVKINFLLFKSAEEDVECFRIFDEKYLI